MIHKPSIERILENECGEGLLKIFEGLIEDVKENGEESAALLVDFMEEDDIFVEGTYVPELWLVVRKVL